MGAASRARLVFNVAQHAEALGSVRVLRRPTGRAQLDRWRTEVLGGLPRRARPLRAAPPLTRAEESVRTGHLVSEKK